MCQISINFFKDSSKTLFASRFHIDTFSINHNMFQLSDHININTLLIHYNLSYLLSRFQSSFLLFISSLHLIYAKNLFFISLYLNLIYFLSILVYSWVQIHLSLIFLNNRLKNWEMIFQNKKLLNFMMICSILLIMEKDFKDLFFINTIV
jgi:hypothetical protein